jgi:hypothetical protein
LQQEIFERSEVSREASRLCARVVGMKHGQLAMRPVNAHPKNQRRVSMKKKNTVSIIPSCAYNIEESVNMKQKVPTCRRIREEWSRTNLQERLRTKAVTH